MKLSVMVVSNLAQSTGLISGAIVALGALGADAEMVGVVSVGFSDSQRSPHLCCRQRFKDQSFCSWYECALWRDS